jgi:hypothetical protein
MKLRDVVSMTVQVAIYSCGRVVGQQGSGLWKTRFDQELVRINQPCGMPGC